MSIHFDPPGFFNVFIFFVAGLAMIPFRAQEEKIAFQSFFIEITTQPRVFASSINF